MTHSKYTQYAPNDLILRDHLAIERTAMANERTLLAYVRTMIGIVAVGGTILKLFDGWLYMFLGSTLIFFGMTLLVIGFLRYCRAKVILYEIDRSNQTQYNSDWMHNLMLALLEKLHLAKIHV